MTTPVGDTQPAKVPGNWFHLEDIPNTMEKKRFEKAAILQRKWFAGEKKVMKDGEKRGDEKYDERFVDNSTITMEWLRQHERVNKKISKLLSVEYLTSTKTQGALIKTMIKNDILQQATETSRPMPAAYLLDNNSHPLAPWDGHLTQDYHKRWQFQYVTVDGTWEEKRHLQNHLDDLFAALGTFSLCIALSKATVRRLPTDDLELIISEVVVYARDTYDFNDSLDDVGNDQESNAGYNTDSQYLGHWNKNDVKFSYPSLFNVSNEPLVTEWPPTQDSTYFCVRNVHYRKWREFHPNRGGDLLIYSDAITVPMSLFITLRT